MPRAERPYSRVYWEAADDPKFSDVWDDNHALSTWLRLLVAADQAWPASATIYHGIHKPSLDKLTRCGLVDMNGASRYRIHGLDAEREVRASKARDAVQTRYARTTDVHPPRIAAATQGVPRQEKTRKDEKSQAVTRTPDDAYDVMLLVENLTRRPFNYREGNNVHDTLVGDVAQHGAERMGDEYRRYQQGNGGSLDAAQLVFGVHNALHPLIKAKPMTEAERKDAEIQAAIAQIKAETKAAQA